MQDTIPAIHAPLLDWALWYAAQGWPVFPCHGKEPVKGSNGFYDATTDAATITQWWSMWPHCNIGAAMGHWCWALDIDPRAGGDGTLAQLEQEHGKLPDTIRSLSGRGDGGGHHLWLVPETGVHHKANLGEGVDVIALGGYIILPPSLHPDTSKPYLWDYGPDEIALQRAPAWLETLIAPAYQTQERTRIAPGDRIQEGTRETTLVSMAGSMRHHGATAEEIYAALGVMNLRCKPPLEDEALIRIANSVERYPPAPQLVVSTSPEGKVAPGWPTASISSRVVATAHEPWREDLLTKKNGDPTQNVANMALFLQHHPYWTQPDTRLWWDSVRGMPMMGNAEIDDDTITTIAEWMGTVEKMPVTQLKLLERCVLKQCRAAPKDLLQTWLNTLLPWDTVPRLDTWLCQITGIPDRPYARGISKILILSMVARAMQPGCLYRYVVIFEGPEEAGKSTLVRALASPEWYVELSIGLDSKESHMMLQGAWVAEMAELDSLSRTEETRLKAFITQRNDSYIPKFSNFRESTPRRCIFIGTTNEESYLKGQTGNTRYMPINVGAHIDVETFEAMREQLFAEALVLYQSDPKNWWRLPDDVLSAAVDEREKRRLANEYEQPLHDWLTMERFDTPCYEDGEWITDRFGNAKQGQGKRVVFLKDETSWPEIARWFLKIETPERWKDKGLQMQIAAALKALKWKSVQVWKNERNTKVWQYQPTENEVPF